MRKTTEAPTARGFAEMGVLARLFNALKCAGFFLICYAQVPLIAGYYLLGDCLTPVMMLLALVPLAMLISCVPGRVGGKQVQSEPIVRAASAGGDPNPDRSLRSEALPLPQKRAFPLRALVCLVVMIAVAAALLFLPLPNMAEVWWLKRLAMGVVISALLPLALRVIATGVGEATSVISGMILYAIGGIVAFFAKAEVLNGYLLGFGLAFVVVSAFLLNDQSVKSGTAGGGSMRAPIAMRRRNRLLISGVMLFGAVILCFDQIRLAAIHAGQQAFIALGRVIAWIGSLFARGQEQPVGGEGGSGEMGLLAGLGGGEAGAFWKMMEKVAFVLAIVIGMICIAFVLRKLWRLLVSAAKKIISRLRGLTDAMSEDYHDEQESLLDWGETRRALGENLKKRLNRLTHREKKWDQLDAREKVRFVARALFLHAPQKEQLGSLTMREAAPMLRVSPDAQRDLADLYDQARYGQNAPTEEQAEALRKEVKI